MIRLIRLSPVACGRPGSAVWAARLASLPGIFISIFLAVSFIATILGDPRQGYAGVSHQDRAAPARLRAAVRAIAVKPARPPSNAVAQDDNNSEELEVSPDQIEKYVAVYKAMQRDRTLTVDQAATRQGLTVQAFRDLESRIQRDGAAQQRARDELQAAAVHATPAGRPSSIAPAP